MNTDHIDPATLTKKRPVAAEQGALFIPGESWEEIWRGMPEFVQADLQPLKTILIHFETADDISAFAKLVGQSVTRDTRSIWYPAAEIGHLADKEYADES